MHFDDAGERVASLDVEAVDVLRDKGLKLALVFELGQRQVPGIGLYYPVENPDLWRTGRCPVYIAHGRGGFYGFPVCERPGFIKVAIELETEIADPDAPPEQPDQEALAQLNETVARIFRGIRPEPAEVITCKYTETPDRDFIIDRHTEHPSVVVASPCSGHGFKFSITSGELAAELATTPAGTYESALWRERFSIHRAETLAGALATEWRD